MRAGVALVVGGLLLGAAAAVGGTLAGIAADDQGATGSSIPYFAMLAVGVVLLAVGVARLGRIRASGASAPSAPPEPRPCTARHPRRSWTRS